MPVYPGKRMFALFQPRYRKEASLVLKNAAKMLHAQRDLKKPEALAEMEESLKNLKATLKTGGREEVEKATANVEEKFGQHFPTVADAGWRENVEVFLVAVVVALGVRTYFLQPFTIPTGSMQPTLNGIIGHVTNEPPPNPLVRLSDFVLHGRKYLNTIATSDDQVVNLVDHAWPVIPWTEVVCSHSSYHLWAPADTLKQAFGLYPGRELTAGQPVARGYFDTGDHVFVDKFSYNFFPPQRSNVFVFTTAGIAGIQDNLMFRGIEGSEFYIKRLAGTPGDTMQIKTPQLFINGQVAQEPGFQRVMSLQDGYRGYSQGQPSMMLLDDPASTFTLPPKNYFALGDNSYNSADSRYWGTVPQENIMGRALFVYWPFLPHWGIIH